MASETALITVLVENSVHQRGLLAEHGLAFWIEWDGRRILFDTGQGMALQHNARALGVDLSAAEVVALSHGHYDHTGGLLAALPDLNRATVYANITAFRDRVIQDADGHARRVGSPIESLEWLNARVENVVPTRSHPVKLGDGIWLTGQIPRQNEFEDTGGAFYLDEACTTPDPVIDDQAVYIKTGKGLIVLLGCAHAGVVNTLDYIAQITGESTVRAVMGGMHLLHATDERLNKTMAVLEEFKPKVVAPGHCTGRKAMIWLKARFAEQYRDCVTGARFEFD